MNYELFSINSPDPNFYYLTDALGSIEESALRRLSSPWECIRRLPSFLIVPDKFNA